MRAGLRWLFNNGLMNRASLYFRMTATNRDLPTQTMPDTRLIAFLGFTPPCGRGRSGLSGAQEDKTNEAAVREPRHDFGFHENRGCPDVTAFFNERQLTRISAISIGEPVRASPAPLCKDGSHLRRSQT